MVKLAIWDAIVPIMTSLQWNISFESRQAVNEHYFRQSTREAIFLTMVTNIRHAILKTHVKKYIHMPFPAGNEVISQFLIYRKYTDIATNMAPFNKTHFGSSYRLG